jgi:hypothetical protein
MKYCIESRGTEHSTYHKRSKANWIGLILCSNCLLKRVIEGKIGENIEETVRRGRRSMHKWRILRKTKNTGI